MRGWRRPRPGHPRDHPFTSTFIPERNSSWRKIPVSLKFPGSREDERNRDCNTEAASCGLHAALIVKWSRVHCAYSRAFCCHCAHPLRLAHRLFGIAPLGCLGLNRERRADLRSQRLPELQELVRRGRIALRRLEDGCKWACSVSAPIRGFTAPARHSFIRGVYSAIPATSLPSVIERESTMGSNIDNRCGVRARHPYPCQSRLPAKRWLSFS